MSGLQFDWEQVSHQRVVAVLGRNERWMNDGSLVWGALAFALGEDAVVLMVSDNTDEVVVTHQSTPNGQGWVSVAALADAIGKPLGWCWVGTNYLGYCDSFTISLSDVVSDALQPRLSFVAAASSVSCFDLTLRSA